MNKVDINTIGIQPITVSVCDSSGNEARYTGEIKIENMLKLSDQLAVIAVKSLIQVLKNPSSLQIHSIKVKQLADSYYYNIEYSAQNGFGGFNRTNTIVDVDRNTKKVDLFSLTDEFVQRLKKVSWGDGYMSSNVNVDIIMDLVNQ
ncbi:MAG: hypothetical protein IJI57_16440 [Flexilinea sp.]|nr:hypothetical protein [Flexilinea sp.]